MIKLLTIPILLTTLCGNPIQILKDVDLLHIPNKENIAIELFGYEDSSMYHSFSDEEIELLFRVVEAEVTGGSFEAKCNVASVIFNRLENGTFGESLTDILVKKQFSCIDDKRIYKVELTETTIDACEYVFANGDTTGGALFFDSTNGKSWAAKEAKSENGTLKWLFRDDAGHDFYGKRKE